MRLCYTPVPGWPPRAWLARCRRGDPIVEVFHGPDVETSPDWFCEAVWDGAFARAAFDETDVVFGSGARRRGAALTFVSSASTVDRLHWHEAAGTVWVANSLVCLLVGIGADLDPTYAGYYSDFKSIRDGLARYARTVSTSAGAVRLTYFDNLAWDGRAMRERPKPAPQRDLTTFAAYRGFLDASLAELAENLSSPDRAVPLQMLGTISSGYDSPTVAVLARPYGLEEAIGFDPSSAGAPDTGLAIAQTLGVRLWRLDRDAWRAPEAPAVPVPFLGVRQIGAVRTLSRSAAMAPWDVPGGYSRPICRRIVETVGVPRDAFGVRKQTASVLFFERDDMLSPASLADYREWLRARASEWRDRGLAAPAPTASPRAAVRLRAALARLAGPRLRHALGLAHGAPLFRHLFPWAVERAKPRYSAALYEAIAARHHRAQEQRARA